ncbi:MAG: hypothetical protein KDA53_12670 [Hyphomonas sp.]|nr:hypothetical protein [Hyphomonas sp.]
MTAREYHSRQVHYMTKSVSYSDAGIGNGGLVKFNNQLPPNAFHTKTIVDVKEAFNAATTNVLTVGTNSTTTNNIVAAGDVNEASAQVFEVAGVGVLDTSTPLDVYVKFTETGTEATAGSADIVLEYVIMED